MTRAAGLDDDDGGGYVADVHQREASGVHERKRDQK